jgi:2-oxoglutarate dehydrogenase E2 component (dihydrolipoamide succinyltransferase)
VLKLPFGGGEHPSPAARKILTKKYCSSFLINGSGKQEESLKEDAVNAVPSMGTPTGGSRGTERTEIVMLRRKVAERLLLLKTKPQCATFNEVNDAYQYDS